MIDLSTVINSTTNTNNISSILSGSNITIVFSIVSAGSK